MGVAVAGVVVPVAGVVVAGAEVVVPVETTQLPP